ncbi:hypothetical protein B0H11DRAFT_1907124 [Mycena galericulata]|nr:hypothetical protein B0H11DRAFT_1907124 [Mycena galericulata]
MRNLASTLRRLGFNQNNPVPQRRVNLTSAEDTIKDAAPEFASNETPAAVDSLEGEDQIESTNGAKTRVLRTVGQSHSRRVFIGSAALSLVKEILSLKPRRLKTDEDDNGIQANRIFVPDTEKSGEDHSPLPAEEINPSPQKHSSRRAVQIVEVEDEDEEEHRQRPKARRYDIELDVDALEEEDELSVPQTAAASAQDATEYRKGKGDPKLKKPQRMHGRRVEEIENKYWENDARMPQSRGYDFKQDASDAEEYDLPSTEKSQAVEDSYRVEIVPEAHHEMDSDSLLDQSTLPDPPSELTPVFLKPKRRSKDGDSAIGVSVRKAKAHRREKARRHRRSLKNGKEAQSVRAAEDFLIQPNECRQVRVNGNFQEDKEWFVTSSMLANADDSFFVVANTLISARKPVIPVSNISSKPRFVRKGEILANIFDPKEYFDTPSSEEELEELRRKTALIAAVMEANQRRTGVKSGSKDKD